MTTFVETDSMQIVTYDSAEDYLDAIAMCDWFNTSGCPCWLHPSPWIAAGHHLWTGEYGN